MSVMHTDYPRARLKLLVRSWPLVLIALGLVAAIVATLLNARIN